MTNRAVALDTLAKINKAGFEKAAARIVSEEFHELQAENGDINLMRTNFETDVGITGIKEQKKASLSVNKTDGDTLDKTVANLSDMARGASADSAYDIAEHQPAETFDAGPSEPDYDLMYDRIMEVQDYAKQAYPDLRLGSVAITFANRRSCYVNSNDVQFESRRGLYRVSTSFASKRGKQASSMNYFGYSAFDLDTPIQDMVNADQLMRESVEQLETQNIPAKFTGDMIITPNSLGSFVGFLTGKVSDGALISGTSVYKDKLGEAVTSDKLSVRCCPADETLPGGYWVTGDGYKAENSTILENGVLKSYLLGLYGANKTGLPRAVNSGGCYAVDSGDTALKDMIAGVEEGILITRFSGGNPNDRGDFSGIAKNSYYVKDGKVQFPIKETTVSGNMVSLLKSIKAVSKERLNFGGSVLPWVLTDGVTAS
jgi:PmbA protein